MSARPQEYPQMTIEEFLAFEEAHPQGKYELANGYLRDLGALLMAGGTNNHAAIAVNISAALKMTLRSRSQKCRPFSEAVSFRANATTLYHPDVTVSCNENDLARNDAIESPSVVVEVLSPSTTLFDHTEKLQTYKACTSIQEYVLVDATRQFIEVYHRLPDGKMAYQTYTEAESIPLSGLGVELSLADCYDGISFG